MDDLFPGADLSGWTDAALGAAVVEVTAEIHRRAAAAGDPAALTDDVFDGAGFAADGEANMPWIVHGILVAPGMKRILSTTRHRCTFVCVDGDWVWNHVGVLADTVRRRDMSGRPLIQTVTLLPAVEGAQVDVISSVASRGPCQARTASSYRVTGQQLELTGSVVRHPGAHSHR